MDCGGDSERLWHPAPQKEWSAAERWSSSGARGDGRARWRRWRLRATSGDDTAGGEAGTATTNGTVEVLKCPYANLYGITKPTKAQMMAVGERERSSSDVEADAKRVEEKLLSATPPAQDFDHGRADLDPTG